MAVSGHSAQAEATSHRLQTHKGKRPRGLALLALEPVCHGDQMDVLMTEQPSSRPRGFKAKDTDFETKRNRSQERIRKML